MSRIVKIISNKVAKGSLSDGSRTAFIDYTNVLSETAKTHKGFISSSSYWKNPIETSSNDKIEIVSISDWKSIQDWDDWYNSDSRKKINNKYQKIIDKENFNILLKKTPLDDIFLL
tara:strand:+ start:126 stop:473 length:348 start_codon:yes stop_codon:yes gene_type:complete